MTHISASPSTSPKDNSSFNPNQIITQITSFIYGIIKKPESINEIKLKEYLCSILNKRGNLFKNIDINNENSMEYITINSDDEY